jgi:transposase InsO family protein
MGNLWKRHGISPAPERQNTTTWREFIRTHLDVLVATDVFTTEVWTKGGLVTYSILFFLHLASRHVPGAGVTPHPHQRWMTPITQNVTRADWGFLAPGHYLIQDRAAKYCPAFHRTIAEAGVKRVGLPARRPNVNAYAERWVKSVKEDCLSRQMLFGERALRYALAPYNLHYHHERNPQGKGNALLLPVSSQVGKRDEPIHCQERLGGLLKYYYREAA